MDSRLKFTEGDKLTFEVDNLFFRNASRYPESVYIDVIRQMGDNYADLPKSDIIQTVSCVVTLYDCYYFNIQYVNPPDGFPIFIDIKQIDVDKYLDSILIKKNFKHGKRFQKKSPSPL